MSERFQFSMRRLFVAVTLLCAAAAAFGGFLRLADRDGQRGAMLAFVIVGGVFAFEGFAAILGRALAAACCGALAAAVALIVVLFGLLGHAVF